MKKIALIAILLLAAAGLGFVKLRPPTYPVAHPARGEAVQAVFATGSVEASVMVPIAARATARLLEMNVDEGSDVKKGEVLARLEDKDLLDALDEAKAREAYAEKLFRSYSQLVTRGTITRNNYNQAQADWEAAKAAVARLATQADYMKLAAPADGTIVRRDGEIGQLIPLNQPVFWMACCAPLRVSAEVDEEDIPLVKPGQNVLIRADAFPGKIFKGTVTSITPKGDEVARSFRVRIGFAEEVPFKIGMTAEANILTSKKENALLIPRTALSGDTIWVVENGKAASRPVKTGIRGQEQVEITQGLDETDRVIVKPNGALRAGMLIQPVEDAPAKAPAP